MKGLICFFAAFVLPLNYNNVEATEYVSNLAELRRAVLNKGNRVVVNHTICLENSELSFAENVVLVLNAKVSDGTLVGDKTKIESSYKTIIDNISFKGSFVGAPESKWFNLIPNEVVDNAPALNSALQLASLSSVKELVLPKEEVYYVRSDIENSSWRDFLRVGTIEIKSGVTFDLNGSTIRCLPNSSHQYNVLFARNAESITIKNGRIQGDRLSHRSTVGEWGYGIELQGVKCFVLENLECFDCWGDGIDIQVSSDGNGDDNSMKTQVGHCLNGLVKNVHCHHNRRQGMSVQGVIGLKVLNSRFSSSSGTNPQSGVDIEPYTINNVVSHVSFDNCEFDNNAHCGMTVSGESVKDISINNCLFYGNQGWELSLRGKCIRVNGCYGKEGYQKPGVRIVGDSEDIIISNCDLQNIYAQAFKSGKHIKEVHIKECCFSWTSRTKSSGFSDDGSLSSSRIDFEKCVFNFNTGSFSDGNMVYLSGNENYKYYYKNCTFNFGGQRARLTNTQSFDKCVFNDCSSIWFIANPSINNTLQMKGCSIYDISEDSIVNIYSPKDGAVISVDLRRTSFRVRPGKAPSVFSSSRKTRVEIQSINREYKKSLSRGNPNVSLLL